MLKIIDSHCHLPHEKYVKTLDELITHAQNNSVVGMINIGTSIKENIHALKVSAKYEHIYTALAIYPHEHIGENTDELLKQLKLQLVSSPKVVALGECGIDITERFGGRAVNEQVELLDKQLELAIELNLPVVIHNRNGDEIILSLLKKYAGNIRGVIHCFSSELEFANKCVDLGFYISFAGNLTYKSNEVLRNVANKVPLERVIVETDSPYLPPDGFRGKPNEPANVVEVIKKIAETREDTFENIANIAYSNTCKLFGLQLC